MSLKQTMVRKLYNPGVPSIAVFFSTLLVSISSWGVQHQGHDHIFTWLELLSPEHFFSLLGVIGSVLGAWLAKSPLKE